MKRNQRLRFVLGGELAEAVTWEAERRQTGAQDLVEDILEKSCVDIVSRWRKDRADQDRRRRSDARVTPVEEVLKMSYGPPDPPRRRRAPGKRVRS